MKKIILCSFLAISILSCKKENNENIKSNETEQITFYKNLLIKDVAKNLKKEFPKELANISDSIIEKIAAFQTDNSDWTTEMLNDTIYLGGNSVITYKKQLEKVDSLYQNKKDFSGELYNLFLDGQNRQLKEISFNNNIIELFWSPMSNGPSSHYQKILLKDNDVIDLGNGLKLLTKSETDKLVSNIHAKGFKNYKFYSEPDRNGVNITKSNNGNYILEFSEYDEEDADCCPSISISFETKDFITIIENTLKIEKNKSVE